MLGGSASILTEGSVNDFPGLSLLTLVFLRIFPGWSMGACGFCLNSSGFLRDRFFSLFLAVFGGWIEDLYMTFFVGVDFLFFGGVACVVPGTTSLGFFLFVTYFR